MTDIFITVAGVRMKLTENRGMPNGCYIMKDANGRALMSGCTAFGARTAPDADMLLAAEVECSENLYRAITEGRSASLSVGASAP